LIIWALFGQDGLGEVVVEGRSGVSLLASSLYPHITDLRLGLRGVKGVPSAQ
jgi:hypothetical protein